MHRLLHPVVSAVLALLAYGSWAAFSNLSFGIAASSRAFAVQGCFAFGATLSLSLLACRLFRHYGSDGWAAVKAFFCCFLLIATIPSLLHALVATPNVVQSILPGLLWGSGYLVLLLTQQYQQHLHL